MLSERSSVDIHALKRQGGMTISEIARRTHHDRKTIRAYLNGERVPGRRERAAPDSFDAFVDYVTARLTEDPHLWAATLLDELRPLGFEGGSYPTLTRQIRARGLRPACTACAHVTKRANAIIEHPPGEETQFDWLELPDPPAHWGSPPTKRAFLLVGSLAHSGVWRAVISPSMDIPHLLAAMTTLLALLGGLTRAWRFDRMRTVLDPVTGDLTTMFAGFAKHHGVQPVVCRPRSGNRKGVVEKNNHTAAQRWWRNLPDELTAEQAQASVETFAAGQDQRRRQTETGGNTTAKAMLAAERLRPLPPVVFPVIVTEERTATRQALIDWRGNRYSVPPELAAAKVVVQQRLGADVIDIATVSGGTVLARHKVAEPGLGVTIRDTGHVTALEQSRSPRRRRDVRTAARNAFHPESPPNGRRRAHRHRGTALDRDQPGRLRAGREEQEHPPMTTPTTTAASVYQQLRSHLTDLKLADAADALPKVLDQAQAEGGPSPQRSNSCCGSRSPRPTRDASPAGSGSRTCHRRHPGRLRPRRRVRHRQVPAGRAGHLPIHRHRDKRAPDRPARSREDPHRNRTRARRRQRRLPGLLHLRSRPRRPLPPRRDRRQMGHHDAVLRRTHAPDHR